MFFDESVTQGILFGIGSGNSAEKRLNALRNMLETVGDLIEVDDIDGACGQLMACSKKCDGLIKPPDFVSGFAALDLMIKIEGLMNYLACR